MCLLSVWVIKLVGGRHHCCHLCWCFTLSTQKLRWLSATSTSKETLFPQYLFSIVEAYSRCGGSEWVMVPSEVNSFTVFTLSGRHQLQQRSIGRLEPCLNGLVFCLYCVWFSIVYRSRASECIMGVFVADTSPYWEDSRDLVIKVNNP